MTTFTRADVDAFEARQAAAINARIRKMADGVKGYQAPPAAPARKLALSLLSEAEIQQSIAAYLDGLGRECFYVWHRMDQPTTCRVGTPDFVGWIRGRPFALEVKRPGAKETREQAGELMRGQLAGAKVAVVHSLGEAVKVLVGF